MKSAWQSTSPTQTKPTRLSLSLACAIALSSAMLIPNQAKADHMSFGRINGSDFNSTGNCTVPCKFTFMNHTLDNNRGTVTLNNNGSIGTYTISATQAPTHEWRNINLTNYTITTTNATGPFKVEFKTSGSSNNSTLTTINNRAERISLSAEAGSSIAVTTLNQYSGSGESGRSELVIQNAGGSITIENLNQSGGDVYQRTNEVTTANITGGHYHQGYGPVNNGYGRSGDGGRITDVNQSGGSFTQHDGQITTVNLSGGSFTQQVTPNPQARSTEQSNQTQSPNISNLNQSGGTFTQQSGTITTLNLKGGVFNHNGGTLSNITLQGGEGNGVFINNTSSAIANITQDGGHHTISKGSVDGSGKVANFTLKSGSLTNNGEITNLTSGSGTTTRETRSANSSSTTTANATTPATTTTTANGSTGFRNAATQDTRATATRHITNNGTLDSLTLNEPTDVINVLNDNGTPIGIIKKLEVQSGESTINTLTGVAQDDKTGISSITIGKNGGSGGSNGAKLTVDTLRVGLQGNQAIQRVTINNDDNSGQHKEFAAKTVQISYINAKFDPNTKISTKLEDYVTEKSQNYVDSSSTPVFTISPQARLSGVTGFQPDGTPIFDVEATLAAGMTSLVVRQSMRRKMLLDTYLAEQSRRSIKNKERRTKQRVEAVVLADAKKQYEKDLATYKQDLAKWEKLAATKENKALIAKYEQEDKAYQKALEQYQKDKAKWDKKNGKLAPAPKAPIAPKAPTKPNLKPNHKDYKKAMAAYTKAQQEHKTALAQYEKDLAKYKLDKAKWDKESQKLAANTKPAPIEPKAPKAPTKPNLKPNHKDYKKAMAAYTKAQQNHKAALAQYEKDLAKYKLDKAKWDKESQKLAKAGKLAPIEPKAPTKPAIIAKKPEMPIKPSLHSSAIDLYADTHGVDGDFFLRPYGGIGDHKTADGAQTNSWSVGTLLGANWDLKLGNSQGNIGFYGGYEYNHNGYKQAGINAQGHTGFLGLRFSHLFAKTKLAGFYYIADINGGWTEILLDQNMGINNNEEARFRANVGNINFGSSIRLGSSIYMAGAKSMLFPSLGVGVEGGYLGDFTMRTQRTNDMYYGGLSQGYAVSYAQANLNYYQEYGKRLSTTLGGGFRYLMNNEVNITPTLNGRAYAIDKDTGSAAHIKLAPFFYQGTFMVNYHTDKAGNFSAGYVAVGGLLGITHNFSMRWHYFF